MQPTPIIRFFRQLALRLVLVLVCTASAAWAQDPWFEQDSLNPGLPPAPSSMDRATPMAAMETFLHLTDQGHFSEAAHLLDLSDVAQADQQFVGAVRAEELAVILERKVVIPWSSLEDRPDGWISGSSDDNDTGRVRRSILIDRLERSGHPVPLRLNRIKVGEDAAPVWVFSRQTVDNIPALHELYGPTELEMAMPEWLRVPAFWGMFLWEVLFLPAFMLLALIAATIAYRILRRIGDNAKHRSVRFVARSSKWPAAIIIFAFTIGTATSRILVVTGIIDAVVSPLVLISYVVAITLAIVLVIDEIFDRISVSSATELADPENAHLRAVATTISAARKFVIVIATLAASGVVLSSITTFGTLGLSLLASAGALTVVLGFAAREVLGNILASVQIALNRSARIGDLLMFEGYFCTVERIDFTYVQLMVWDGTRLIVPVSTFVSDPFENWSIEDTEMIRPIYLTLAHGADVAHLRKVFFDLLDKEDPSDVAPMDRAKVNVIEQDAIGMKVRFELPTANPGTFWDVECRVREALLAEAARLECESDRRVFPMIPQDITPA
ncbi:Mechanosensitive channel MscK precursor [Sulfitobacter sp. THAF37]|uniref:mechanosensitive ion channel family protein n=1 Tax=Sulfitobacter sp. THAF37 TaxID=2587855 RepID=UPI00126845A6|nr:mechanosensitive ion channel domain-containing protein [Sulfitobacter sp. THAF37]QFT60179.1 Mechanosensitive channel MscK precursor [Sulfitobacter sp. THAF37]